MSQARIEFSIGSISFMGEGEQEWVAAQLDKILDKSANLIKLTPKRQVDESNLSTLPLI